MDAGNWWLIKIILGTLAAIFGLLAALFTFRETAQNQEHEKTRTWFRQKWESINKSKWLSLPEKIISWILRIKTHLKPDLLSKISYEKWFKKILWISAPILLGLGCFLTWGIYAAIIAVILTLPIPLQDFSGIVEDFLDKMPEFFLLLYFAMTYGMIGTLLTLQILNADIIIAFLAMLVLFPFYWAIIIAPVIVFLEEYSKFDSGKLFPFSFAAAISFTVTFFAILLGHLANPSAWQPKTFQMLMSNVIFDGFTMVVTLMILSWAIKGKSTLRIPIALFFDIVIAALFACCSLFFGLVFTEKALSLKSILYILMARSPDGTITELGPYFWAMHTTFLPTLVYLSIILFGWLGKTLLIPIKWFFGLGQEHKNPLKLTAGLFGLIAAIFFFLTFAANAVHR